MLSTRINRTILESINVNRNLKRYCAERFTRLEKHNGAQYAADDFKVAREVLMAYRADPHRRQRRDHYLEQFPWHTNGWVRMMFDYMDSQPQCILQLVKLYCGLGAPLVTVDQASISQHKTLDAARAVNTKVPGLLVIWLSFVLEDMTWRRLTRYWYKLNADKSIRGIVADFARKHDSHEFCEYHQKWHRILCRFPVVRDDDKELASRMENREPIPEVYCDYGKTTSLESGSLAEDLRQLGSMDAPAFEGFGPEARPPLSSKSLDFVFSKLSPEMEQMLLVDHLALLEDLQRLDPRYKPKFSVSDGLFVGNIHHIPKTGTVKRRSIAVPNRFLQLGLVPVDYQLERLLRRLPQDCTFDQGKLDSRIQSRMSSANDRYVGSVDLSQATDHLPFEWMKFIWELVLSSKVCSEVKASWKLFVEMTEAPWNNEGFMDKWRTGQPLGSLPSFKCLAITHNLLLESISFGMGAAHSPYAILGDDLVVFNRKVRSAYIKLMQNAGVPLSLHKSYQGHLVEFAGKIFVRNMAPFYNTDHRPITWNSLFDYQWATGIYLPWEGLPKAIRCKWCKGVSKTLKRLPSQAEAKRLYHLAFLSGISPRGSSTPTYGQEEDIDLLANLLLELEDNDTVVPDRTPVLTGMYRVWGHPVTYLPYGDSSPWISTPQKYKRPFRRTECQWFRDKYRPVATDKLASCAGEVLKHFVESQRAEPTSVGDAS